jgi:putative PIN family toxin of toxin-antitoxin system
LCPQLLAEIERALRKPYFRDLVEEREISEIVATIRDAGIVLNDPVDPPTLLRDPNDDYLVALARGADAVAIVTGDRDLLEHAGLEPPALPARAACELLDLV